MMVLVLYWLMSLILLWDLMFVMIVVFRFCDRFMVVNFMLLVVLLMNIVLLVCNCVCFVSV